LQRADFESALEEFQEAVRIDPEFAMAHFRTSITARWLSDGVTAHQAARNAVAKVGTAPPSYREVIRANALYQEGAYSQAIPLLEAVLEAEPSLKEGLYLLSQIYIHSSRDNDSRRAMDLMERLLTLDPEFYLVYDRLALTYGFQGDMGMARKRLDEWESIRPEKVQGLRSVLATLEGQPEEALGFSQAFSWMEGPLFMTSAAMLASRWDIAGRLAEYDPDEWKADHLRAWSFRNRGTFHTYMGAWDQAVVEYRQAGRVSGLRVHEGETGGVPASALQSLAELLDLQGDVGGARREAEQALALQPESARGLYYAGRYSLRDDDFAAAQQYLRKLDSLPAASTSGSIQMYQSALRAELALFQGDADLAARILRGLTAKSLVIDWPTTCSSAGALFRDSLARAYMAMDLAERAENAWEELVASGFERVDHPAIFVRALYSIGVAKLERGEPRGRRYLEQFLEHWGEADWQLPEIEDAKQRLAKDSGQ
jgi:tetratricopeptide (TPR) repeat protein